MIDAPYPADLEAKGWSLDFDYEKIEQSDTWAIATVEQRPWLLMLWLTSWRQVPIASFPNNDRLIAARIGMPLEQFTAWKDVLLSGWNLASDGRLYHKTLTQHVLKMAEKRNKDRLRVAEFRSKSPRQSTGNAERDTSNVDVTRYTQGGNSDVRVSSAPSPPPSPPPLKSKPSSGDCPPDFEIAWAEYPKRPGASKVNALKAWKARIRSGVTPDDILGGVRRYAAYCKASQREAEFIQHPSTFFGPGEHYLADWTVQPRASPGFSKQAALEQRNAEAAREFKRQLEMENATR